MKKISLLGITVSALLLSNCSNEEIMEKIPTGNVVVSATMENGSDTRANVDDSGYFTWTKGDEIAVYTTNSQDRWVKFSLKGEGGTATGSFTGTIVGDGITTSTCAVYPYNESKHTLNGNTLTFHMPDSYNYKEEGNTNAPMLALISSEGSKDFPFKHLGGVLRFKVNNVPANTTQFVFTTSHQITGDFTVTDINDSEAKINTSTGPVSNKNTVTIKMEALAVPSNKIFYVPMPVGTYTSMKIEFKDNSGKVLNESSTTESNTIERRTLLRMPTITCTNVEGSIVTTASDVANLNSLLSNAESAEKLSSITLSGEGVKNISDPITIPETYTNANDAGDTPKVLNLTFDDVPEVPGSSKAIEIKDENASASTAEQSKAKVEVSIPAITGEQTAPSFAITLPTATVTLSATGESATYNEVTASTATNTLIVGKGVTINKLIVKGGNVRVKDGSKVTEITRDDSNSKTVIIYREKGATLPDLSANSAFIVVDAAVAEMQEVAKNGGTYTLISDVEGDFIISAADVTINLNGYKITNKSGDTFTVNKDCKLTINGKGTVDNVTHAKACIYNNGTVVLNGGTYIRSKENGQNKVESGGNSYYNILNHGEMTINSNVEVSQSGQFSSMISNGYFTYTKTDPRSGYVSGTNHQNPLLTINGGTFSGGLNTVKNDDGGKLSIVDGIFTNMSQATVQNHHVTEIKGGTFNTTGSAEYVVDNEGHNGAANDLGQMTISGGTLNGKIYVVGAGASLTVTGGTFSDPNVLTHYLGKEAEVKVILQENYEGPGFGLYEAVNKKQYGMHAAIEVDLNNHTWSVLDTPLFGSTGYESQYFHLEKGAKVTFKNGTVKPADSGSGKMLIQNYCDLTLEGLTLEGGSACEYVVSNNNGICDINNSTVTAAEGMCAFDVFSYSSYTGIVVNVNNSTINGKVEFGGNNNRQNGKLIVTGGTMNGNLVVTKEYYNSTTPNIIIDGVSYGSYTGWSDYLKK